MPGPSYKGFEVMLTENRIRQAEPLQSIDRVRELFRFYTRRYQTTTKKYFPMRIQNTDWIGFIRRAIVEFGWDEMKHDSETRIENIDRIMGIAPEKHTVIFIKSFWRASKRLTRKHIGGSYEQVPKKSNFSSAAQGLIARHCDNYDYEGDELDPNLRPVHFGDKEAIEAYVKWFNSGCDYRLADYKSSKITSQNGHVKAKASKLHSTNFVNLDAVHVENGDPDAHKRIPVVVQLNEAQIRDIDRNDNASNPVLIKSTIRNLYENDPAYEEFIGIITSHVCFQKSSPHVGSARSYKIHIEDVVHAWQERRKYGIMDANVDMRTRSCWQVYIDKQNFRLCILWQVF